MDYAKAVALLGDKTAKKIGNNTLLRRNNDGTVSIELHGTPVVTINTDNQYTLNSGGWRTVTTKRRINDYAPVRLYQHNFSWQFCDSWDRQCHDFYDGVVVNKNGQPV